MLILKPSKVHGVGVFTTVRIKRGEKLPLFQSRDTHRVKQLSHPYRKSICVWDAKEKAWWCPLDFGRMSIGWYLNHSEKANVMQEKWIALRDIKSGEELTVDYSRL